MITEIEDLDRQGFTKERYRSLAKRFIEWNAGVWDHSWKIAQGPCALCQSTAPGVLVQQLLLCLSCLTSHPLVPWHPTGSIRPRVSVLLTHAASCEQHLTI